MKKSALSTILTALLVVLSVLTGIFAGYNHLGWTGFSTGLAGEHGALMVGSFLGTLIALERAVVAKNKWFLLVPLVNALSLPLFLFGFADFALLALVAGSAGLCYLYLDIIHRYKELYFYVMLAGAACWLIGNILAWKYHFYPQALPWWISFLLLTITGERLELSKFLPIRKWQKGMLLALLGIFVIAAGTSYHGWGQGVAGAAMLLTALWLLRFDMIRKSLKRKGLHRFSAVMLGMGYIWLGLSGIAMMLSVFAQVAYDVLVHTFFIGFTFSMIFAHGPVILPGIAKLPFHPFSPGLYVWGGLLHLSLLVRMCGSIHGFYPLKYWGGILNGIFIVAYFITIGYQVLRMRKARLLKAEVNSLFS
ncbi:hypothetical protein [Nafulsella turpanensis]|uniref:hypothetical protein n=1 Tax=Nafulsella turpanensis TaxID=1265690 RepID=UPI00034B29C8|nr:hypothetical protein [Nafulsella turpanensis]